MNPVPTIAAAATSIERTSLEAHVELCAERHERLEEKLDNLQTQIDTNAKSSDRRMTSMETVLKEIKDLINNQQKARDSQLIKWGAAIIGSLVSVCAFLLYNQIT